MSIQVLAGQNAVSSDMKDASGHNDELDMDLIYLQRVYSILMEQRYISTRGPV